MNVTARSQGTGFRAWRQARIPGVKYHRRSTTITKILGPHFCAAETLSRPDPTPGALSQKNFEYSRHCSCCEPLRSKNALRGLA